MVLVISTLLSACMLKADEGGLGVPVLFAAAPTLLVNVMGEGEAMLLVAVISGGEPAVELLRNEIFRCSNGRSCGFYSQRSWSDRKGGVKKIYGCEVAEGIQCAVVRRSSDPLCGVQICIRRT